jgi:hypothetical protein
MSSKSSGGGGGGGGGGNFPRRQRVRLDEALSGWPVPDRSALEWDESAEAVMARLASRAPGQGDEGPLAGVSDEALLSAPLPASREEVQGSAAPGRASVPAREEASMNPTISSRQRDRASLKELAKMAETAPPSSQPSQSARASRPSVPGAPASGSFEAREAPASGSVGPERSDRSEREENSGIIHLAALTPDPSVTEAAPSSRNVPAVASVAAPSSVPAGPVPTAPKEAKRWRGLFVFGSMVAAAAVAAGVFVGMRRPASELSAPVAAVPSPVQAIPGPTTATGPVAMPTPVAEGDKGVDPSTLPPVDTSGAVHGAPVAASAPKAASNGVAAAPAPVPATATATTDPKLIAVVPSSTAAPGDGKSLEALMQQAAGVTSGATPAAPAAPDAPQVAPGSVPLKPSAGAIHGALGAALPGARACVDPDDAISHAMVTFQSDGSVQSVSVSGGAAGKPAEACIRAALMKARVPPFANPTFSAPATIRGN